MARMKRLKNGSRISKKLPLGTATYSEIMESLKLTPREIAHVEKVIGHKLHPWRRTKKTPSKRSRAAK
jgi:hypothetical protein